MIGRLLCKVRLHSWEDVGMTGFFSPVSKCRRCGWFQVFTGYAVVLYPPNALKEDEL